MIDRAETNNEPAAEQHSGVITALADLPPDGVLDVNTLAHMLGRCSKTIQRAVRRGELPQPVKFMGKRVWLVKTILEHLESRQKEAMKEANRRISKLPRTAP